MGCTGAEKGDFESRVAGILGEHIEYGSATRSRLIVWGWQPFSAQPKVMADLLANHPFAALRSAKGCHPSAMVFNDWYWAGPKGMLGWLRCFCFEVVSQFGVDSYAAPTSAAHCAVIFGIVR